jgi:MoxR-like ATPase
MQAQADVKKIHLSPEIEEYIVRIIDATRRPTEYELDAAKYIDFGASPRSTIAIFITAKAHALVQGRIYVTPHDVKQVAPNVLRHRILLNYEGQAEGVSSDEVISEILAKVPIHQKQ